MGEIFKKNRDAIRAWAICFYGSKQYEKIEAMRKEAKERTPSPAELNTMDCKGGQ